MGISYAISGSERDWTRPESLQRHDRNKYPLEDVMASVEELLQGITLDPGKRGGKPCVRGMRIRIASPLRPCG